MTAASKPAIAILALFFALITAVGCSGSAGPPSSKAVSSSPSASPSSEAIASGSAVMIELPPPAPACPDAAPPAPVGGEKPSFLVQRNHARPITQTLLSGNGRLMVTVGLDSTVRVWDTTTGLLVRRILLESLVNKIAISDAGNTLVYYAADATAGGGVIAVIDLAAGAPPKAISHYGELAVAPDGKTVAVGLTNLALYDAKTGAKTRELDLGLKPNHIVLSMAMDASGTRIAVGAVGEIIVVDVPAWKISSRFPLPALAGPMDHARALSFAGDMLVSRSTVGIVHILSPAGGSPATRLPGTFLEHASAGSRLFTIDSTTGDPAAWNIATGQRAPFVAADPRQVHKLGISSDASTVALVTADQRLGNFIVLQDLTTMAHIRTFEGPPTEITSLAVRPDGKQFTTGSIINTLVRWNLESGELEQTMPFNEASGVESITYDEDGAQVAWTARSYFVRVRNTTRGRIARQWKPHGDKMVAFAQFLPQSSDLITVAADGSVARWDLGGAVPAPPAKHPMRFDEVARPQGKPVGSFGRPAQRGAISPAGNLLALDDASGSLGVIDLASGAVRWSTSVPTISPYHDRWIAFSPDGSRLLLSAIDLLPNAQNRPTLTPTLRVYNALTGALLSTEKPKTAGPIAGRGGSILLGGVRPVVLDAATLAVRAPVAIVDRMVSAAAAHPTRDLFILGGDGGSTSLVSVGSGKLHAVLVATAGGDFMTSTPDGAFSSSLDGARSIAWSFASPTEGYAFEQFAVQFNRPELVRKRLAGEEIPPLPPPARPPRIEVAIPALSSVATDRIALRASVSSAHRVDRVRVFVNGWPAVDQPVCAASSSLSLENVPLQAGRNRVAVVAYDAAGFSSNPQKLDILSTAPRARRPELWVISVGVSQYSKLGSEHQLDYADDDARSIAGAFAGQVGQGKPFAKLHPITLFDSEVTVDSVKQAVQLLEKMSPDDLAVVFMAGHGVRRRDGKMVFLTSGADLTPEGIERHGVGWDVIQGHLGQAKGRVMVLLDACHSGHVSTDIIAPNEALAAALASSRRAGVLVFAAARGSQLSYEVPPGNASLPTGSRGLELALEGPPPPLPRTLPGGHGLFTSAVLEAMAGGAPDRDRSGAVEVDEFMDHVTWRVRTTSQGAQTPWIARREMFGDFVVAPMRR
jgi:WD40 repeat protein/uncharacterized caspase-like protein